MQLPSLAALVLASWTARSMGGSPQLTACEPGSACASPAEAEDTVLLQKNHLQHAGARKLDVGDASLGGASGKPSCSSYEDCRDKYIDAEMGRRQKFGASLPEDLEACDLEDPSANGCPITGMSRKGVHFVAPGGSTGCIDSSSRYVFQVRPGDADKLLFFFQGGGACFSRDTTVIHPTCTTAIEPEAPDGVFNRSGSGNHFANYTIVTVLYCSGDAHVGNVSQVYNDSSGEQVTIQQVGYFNAKSALDWTLAQNLTLQSLVVAGCSAGSLGAQGWARTLLQSFAGRVTGNMAVIADSYLDVPLPGLPGLLFLTFGACSVPLWTPSFVQSCVVGQASLTVAFQEAMDAHPDSVFSAINSKADKTQILYYNLFRSVAGLPPIVASDYTTMMNVELDKLNSRTNFVSYVVTGDAHCFLPRPYLFTTDPRGNTGTLLPPPELCQQNGASSHVMCPLSTTRCSGDQCCPPTTGLVGKQTFPCPSANYDYHLCAHRSKVTDCLAPPPPLTKWLKLLPVPQCGEVASVCDGQLLRKKKWTGSDYCAASQAGKEFTNGAGC